MTLNEHGPHKFYENNKRNELMLAEKQISTGAHDKQEKMMDLKMMKITRLRWNWKYGKSKYNKNKQATRDSVKK